MERRLYRITDNTSRDQFSEIDGFVVPKRDTFDEFNPTGAGAREFVELHLDWSNRRPTPFISTVDSPHIAMYLTRKRILGRTGVRIAIIDRDAVENQEAVYHMESLVDTAQANLPSYARNDTECLCVHRIPREAILKLCSPEEFEFYFERLGELAKGVSVYS
jgi:hypothetical protein